jgi:hypothetical protein
MKTFFFPPIKDDNFFTKISRDRDKLQYFYMSVRYMKSSTAVVVRNNICTSIFYSLTKFEKNSKNFVKVNITIRINGKS